MSDQEKHQMLFVQLISMFHAAALQQMGKIKNPATDKVERDMEQAELSIDMLDMLMNKTKGNISPEEEKVIADLVAQLKLNYVDEKAKDSAATKDKPKEEPKKE